MAKSIIATICVNMLIQLFVTFAQNRKMGVKRLVRELLVTASMLQPAVLAFRVAAGKEKDIDSTISPEVEMVGSRIVDVVAESLPASILQIYAYVRAEKKSKIALVSILISAMTTSFVGTSISCDSKS